jgi:hypothetical protein
VTQAKAIGKLGWRWLDGGNKMPSTLARQSFATLVLPENADNIVPTAPWRFALVLLGLAAALIIIGAAFPEFFTGSLSHFGPDTP